MGRPRKNIEAVFEDGIQAVMDGIDNAPVDTSLFEARGLTPEQEDLLITDTLRRMYEDGTKRDLQGGVIPALVRSPVGDKGAQYLLVDVDVRVLEEIWQYYRTNVPRADFMKLLEKLDGMRSTNATKHIYARVGYMNVE